MSYHAALQLKVYVFYVGIVYLDDIEAELVQQQLLMEHDNNFERK